MKSIQEQHGFFKSTAVSTIEQIAPEKKAITFNKLWLYPASGMTGGGKLTANIGDIYVGKRGAGKDITPDLLATGDGPIKYELPDGIVMRLDDIIIQADNIGDGVFYSYWTL